MLLNYLEKRNYIYQSGSFIAKTKWGESKIS